tara:strand:- start:11711 stop:12325 length:615 start_codon:yes stop_codon:yes gene_type:complete
MASGDTDLSTVNNSLRLLGVDTITSLTDGTKRASIANGIYTFVKHHTLSMYPWKFALKKVELARDSATPNNEWTYQYSMPSDSVTGLPNTVFFSGEVGAGSELRFDIYERKVLTDSTTVFVDYVYNVGEDAMPSYFITLLIYQVAWHLAEPLTDQTTKADYWKKTALGNPIDQGRGGYFRVATQIDAQGQPPNVISDYVLTNMR